MNTSRPKEPGLRLSSRLAFAGVFLAGASFCSGELRAQSDTMSPIPHGMRHRETEETGDDESDDLLPPDPAGDQKLEREATATTPFERRSAFHRGASLAVGATKPWQTITGEFGQLARPDWFLLIYAGTGVFQDNGTTIDNQTYNLRLTALSVGVAARYFVHKLDLLAFEGSVGAGGWNGTVTPRALASASTASDTFHGLGLTAGLAAVLSWVWDNGYFIDWTIAGLQVGRVLSMNNSRDNAAVTSAWVSDVQSLRLYGIIDLRVGLLF